jgi:hypothetical protein
VSRGPGCERAGSSPDERTHTYPRRRREAALGAPGAPSWPACQPRGPAHRLPTACPPGHCAWAASASGDGEAFAWRRRGPRAAPDRQQQQPAASNAQPWPPRARWRPLPTAASRVAAGAAGAGAGVVLVRCRCAYHVLCRHRRALRPRPMALPMALPMPLHTPCSRGRDSWARRHAMACFVQEPSAEQRASMPSSTPPLPAQASHRPCCAVAAFHRLLPAQGCAHRSGSRSSRTDRGYYWRISAELARHSSSVQCCSHAPLTIGSVILPHLPFDHRPQPCLDRRALATPCHHGRPACFLREPP